MMKGVDFMQGLVRCDKCHRDFDRKDLQESHDIPRYMGGNDADGRRLLCLDCHKEFESEVVKVAFMNFVRTAPENIKSACRNSAKMVCNYFFKGGSKNDG